MQNHSDRVGAVPDRHQIAYLTQKFADKSRFIDKPNKQRRSLYKKQCQREQVLSW